MRIVTLDQNSPEWKVWRHGGLGASDASSIVGLSPWTSREQLLRQKQSPITGTGDYENSAMSRGKLLEPHARQKYEDLMGWASPPVCVLHPTYDWMRASLDGWNAEKGIPLEIKCPNKDDHTCALEGRVPMKYIPQVHHQLIVTGAKVLHYLSYSNYFPAAKSLALVVVPMDNQLQDLLLQAEQEFWAEVLEGMSEASRMAFDESR